MAKNIIGTKLPRKLDQKMQIVGEQIKLARLRRNLSVAQIAERVTQIYVIVSLQLKSLYRKLRSQISNTLLGRYSLSFNRLHLLPFVCSTLAHYKSTHFGAYSSKDKT